MPTITVRFFAVLKEEFGIDCTTVETGDNATVEDVWKEVTQKPVTRHIFCAVNHRYTTWNQVIKAGDEVAFFPPVSGG